MKASPKTAFSSSVIFDQPFDAHSIDAEKAAGEPEAEVDPTEREQGVKFSSRKCLPRSKTKLLLPNTVENLMKLELRAAGRTEIGGVLLGELVGPGISRVAEITVQRTGGTSPRWILSHGLAGQLEDLRRAKKRSSQSDRA